MKAIIDIFLYRMPRQKIQTGLLRTSKGCALLAGDKTAEKTKGLGPRDASRKYLGSYCASYGNPW